MKKPARNMGSGLLRFTAFVMFVSMAGSLQAVPGIDSLHMKHRLKADLVPLYNVLFHARKQMRIGLEYQRISKSRNFLSIHLDAGVYDDYTYFKYYDFFNQAQGLHYDRQDVRTYGFHLLPAWNYKLGKRNSARRVQCFTGVTADINCFWKTTRYFHSFTEARYRESDRQLRLGAGPHLGMSIRISKRIRTELKAICVGRLLTLKSDETMQDIRPFQAAWFDQEQYVWVIPQFNVCYDFR